MEEWQRFEVPEVLQEKTEEDRIYALREELKKMEREIERLKHDSLTGLARRPDAEDAKEIKERRKRSNKPWTTLMLDIDRFKTINDRYGHPIGDDVIAATADALRHFSRANDVVMRWGGEEFVVLFNNATPQDIIDKLYNKNEKKAEISFELTIDDQKIPVTLSGGVASFEKEDGLEEAVGRADAALLWAKTHGRNQIANYDVLPPKEEKS